MGLGDAAERVLASVGITPERVERWLGRPCGCRERKERMNIFGQWLARQFSGHGRGKAELDGIMEESEKSV